MKKRLIGSLLAGMLAVVMTVPVFAEDIDGGKDLEVTFTSLDRLETNYTYDQLNQTITDLQPGDTVSYKFTVSNENKAETQFYLSNAILKAFEESNESAAGGAYGYELIYTAPNGEEMVLYSSDTVGGEGELGLKEATGSLENYVYLGALKQGESGYITLAISLDGETEGNAYQSAVASLNMRFAVEKGSAADPNKKPNPIKTGDYSYLYLYAGLGLGVGLILFAVAFLKLKKDRDEEEVEA